MRRGGVDPRRRTRPAGRSVKRLFGPAKVRKFRLTRPPSVCIIKTKFARVELS